MAAPRSNNLGMNGFRPTRSNRISAWSLIACTLTGCICFYAGVLWGMQAGAIENLKHSNREFDLIDAAMEPKGRKGRFAKGTVR